MFMGLKQISSTCRRRSIPLVVESDTLEVINVLIEASEDLFDLKTITDQIISIASSLQGMEFWQYNRILNTVAHYVAKKATNFSVEFDNARSCFYSRDLGHIFWVTNLPSWFFPPFDEGMCKNSWALIPYLFQKKNILFFFSIPSLRVIDNINF